MEWTALDTTVRLVLTDAGGAPAASAAVEAVPDEFDRACSRPPTVRPAPLTLLQAAHPAPQPPASPSPDR